MVPPRQQFKPRKCHHPPPSIRKESPLRYLSPSRFTRASATLLVGQLTERLRSTRGATAAEYALLLATIAVVIVLAVTAFGQAVSNLFQTYPQLISS